MNVIRNINSWIFEKNISMTAPPWINHLKMIYKMSINAIQRAICSTISYRDIFDYPMTLPEIHRYLHRIPCTPEELSDAVWRGPLLDGYLDTDGEYFALHGRRAIFETRRVRRELSRRKRPLARVFARLLASLPNVRMVAMTGSLAVGNLSASGDIDFLLVTDSGSMWRTRAFCRFLALLDNRLGSGAFCPNTFLSMAALSLPRRSMYDAQELCQMIPLFGDSAYVAVREANAWTADWLPNADGAPMAGEQGDPLSHRLKRCGEWLLDSRSGRALERFEATRKIHRFNETDRLKGAWTRSTDERHSMWDEMRLKIEGAWQQRLEACLSEEGAPALCRSISTI
jgi:hypothetical protein